MNAYIVKVFQSFDRAITLLSSYSITKISRGTISWEVTTDKL